MREDSAATRVRLADLLVEVARCVDRNVVETVPSSLGSDPRLEALRSVLLEQERVALARLQRQLDDPQAFAETVGLVLADAFALAAARDDRLATVLAPTMERATQESIRKNPDTLVGILYPVVGPAIRKAVTESIDGSLQRLNKALKHSFSWQGLKWRLEALRSGTSFADVVLKHTVEFRVEHVFLIHCKTGLLLEHVALQDASTQDPQLVSGMLAAIQDFVRDSFAGERKDSGGIETLRLGELLLWCEQGPSAFLAAVIRGNPPESLHEMLRETLIDIHARRRGVLEEFDGDDSQLGDLKTPLQACLQEQEQVRVVKSAHWSPWMWGVPLASLTLLCAWGLFLFVTGHRVAGYVDRLRAEPGMLVVGVERRGSVWHVTGLRDPLASDPAVLLADAHLTSSRVVGHWQRYQALDPETALKRLAATLKPPPSVKLSVVDGTIRAAGDAPEHWVEQARTLIAAQPAGSPPVDLTALKDIQDPTFNRLRDALQTHIITFDSNAPRPSHGQEVALDAVAEELRELIRVANGLGFSARVMIVGHTDSVGNETANLALGQARAEVVRFMLRERGIAPDRLAVRSAGLLEPLLPGADTKSAAMNRRVTLTVGTSD